MLFYDMKIRDEIVFVSVQPEINKNKCGKVECSVYDNNMNVVKTYWIPAGWAEGVKDWEMSTILVDGVAFSLDRIGVSTKDEKCA